MKEIKAYVRPDGFDPVIRALEEAGARDITVIRVDALGAVADAEANQHRILRRYDERYSRMAKVEIVCRDGEAGPFAEAIRSAAHTGRSGDGRVIMAPIERAINIRTQAEGDQAL
jgi:nitrogen regulatory protein PII